MEFKEMRKSKGLTQAQVADFLGITRAAYTNIENGHREADYSTLSSLSELFSVSIDSLLGKKIPPQKKKGVKIPILGNVRAGIPIEAIEEILGYEEISEEMAAQGMFFALRVNGDSMEPLLLEKDIIIIRQQSDVDSGDIAVVLINGDDATVKKIHKQDNGITLMPINPQYTPIFFTTEEILNKPVTIIGKMVELRRKF